MFNINVITHYTKKREKTMTIIKVTSHYRAYNTYKHDMNAVKAYVFKKAYSTIHINSKAILDTNKLFKSICEYVSTKLESGNNYLENLEYKFVDFICSL